jgi:hypothetical protein
MRKQGKRSEARRPSEEAEFRELIRRVYTKGPAHTQRYSAAAFYIFQFHLIGRLDDVAKNLKWRISLLALTTLFAYNLKYVGRSKNVLEERYVPKQIIIGAMDLFFAHYYHWEYT